MVRVLSNISGFPEFLPQDQIVFDGILRLIRQRFEFYGFTPLETPAVERVSTLLAKGDDVDNEIYGIYRLAHDGPINRELALRFDLTVPLARYVAQHYGSLIFPYRRYHIAPVWRGERAQAGRYRQFYQCDIDIIGDGELSVAHDAEVICVINDVLGALDLGQCLIKVNNRKIISGIILALGLDEDHGKEVIKIMDKAHKIGRDKLVSELLAHGILPKAIEVIEHLCWGRLDNRDWLAYLEALPGNDVLQEGIKDIATLFAQVAAFGVTQISFTPGLARGLNYYTGTVCEVTLIDFPDLGSICGGGRYANLVGTFTKKQFPGVGLSIGISRLMAVILDKKQSTISTTASVLVTVQNHDLLNDYIEIANAFRSSGVKTELYLAQKNLGAQLKYGASRGFRYVVIAEASELAQGKVIVRDLSVGSQLLLGLDEAILTIKQILH